MFYKFPSSYRLFIRSIVLQALENNKTHRSLVYSGWIRIQLLNATFSLNILNTLLFFQLFVIRLKHDFIIHLHVN